MFPPVSQRVDDRWARELVDDAASSICVDAQEYVELDTAMQAFEHPVNRPLTDFEKYNRVVAKKMILDGELGLNDADTIDLESIRPPLEDVPYIYYDLFKFMVLGGAITLSIFNETQNLVPRCGPLGAMLGAVIGAVLHELSCHPITELMSFYPLKGGLGSYVAMYINPSLGFGVNCAYWMICVLGAPTQLNLALPMLSQIHALNTPDYSYVVWMLYFVGLMVAFSLLNKRYQIGIATWYSFVMVTVMVFFLVLGWLLADGRVGPYFHALKATYWHDPQWQANGFFNEFYGSASGAGARVLQLVDSSMLTYRSCSTVDKVYTLIPKVRNPRKSMKKTRWYRRARLVIFWVLPVMTYSLILSPSDMPFVSGTLYPTLEGPLKHVPHNRTLETPCRMDLTKWKGFEGLNTYMLVYVSLARQGMCWAKPVFTGVSIFYALSTASLYHLAATHVLSALLEEPPLRRLVGWVRPSVRKRAAGTINLLICIIVFVVGFTRFSSYTQFLTLVQTTYSYLLLVLLNWSYLRFRKAVELYSGPIIDRLDVDWPYRARGGTWCAWLTIVVIGTFCVVQYFFYAIPLRVWGPIYFFAHYMFELVVLVAASCHWYFFRTSIVGIDEINVVAAKRKLDDQEWVEDRVFHRGPRGRLVHRWEALLAQARMALGSVVRSAAAALKHHKS